MTTTRRQTPPPYNVSTEKSGTLFSLIPRTKRKQWFLETKQSHVDTIHPQTPAPQTRTTLANEILELVHTTQPEAMPKVQQLLQTFDANPTHPWSPSYTTTQRALVPLLALSQQQFAVAFAKLRALGQWKATTVKSRAATLVSLAKELQCSLPVHRDTLIIAQRELRLEPGRWTEVESPQSLIHTFQTKNAPPAAQFAALTGMRFGDVAGMQTADVHLLTCDNEESFAVKMHGKTADRMGCWTLHVQKTSVQGMILQQALDSAINSNSKTLFNHTQREGIQDVRALRRGALSTLSVSGWAEDKIRQISRHSQHGNTLSTYLGDGLYNKQLRDTQWAMQRDLAASLLAQEPRWRLQKCLQSGEHFGT